MRTLFLRIFVSFWVAMLVILVGGIVVTTIVASQRIEALENLQPGDVAIEAGEALERGGLDGLRRWLRDIERERPGLAVYVVGPDGRDLLGREFSPRVRRWVEFLDHRGVLDALHPGRPPPPGRRMHRWAPQLVAPDGTVYTLLMTASGRPPFGVLGTLDVPLTLLALALLVSGLVSWWLARYIARPVTRLQSSARAIAAGNLDTRVGAEFGRRHDELGVLARDFDQMAERLRALIAARDVLLRDLSHELRSPLARLRVALGLARRPGADQQRELDRIEREAERLDELIGELLRLSRLSSPEPSVTAQEVDLAALVADVAEDARLEGAADRKAIECRGSSEARLVGDEELLRSAVENVLRNALRFTPPGASVSVELATSGPDLVLTIRDHGPGVPEADLARIFEPFYRVAEARDRASGGTGLGLAIVARVVALHGGTVQARNAPDVRLVVEIRLPAKRSRESDPPPRPAVTLPAAT